MISMTIFVYYNRYVDELYERTLSYTYMIFHYSYLSLMYAHCRAVTHKSHFRFYLATRNNPLNKLSKIFATARYTYTYSYRSFPEKKEDTSPLR